VSEDGLHLKVDPYGWHKSWSKRIVRVAKEEGSLADGRVADYQQFKHVIEVLIRGISAILTSHLRKNYSC